MAQQGKIIFVVTHDVELICQACSRVLHIDAGGVTENLAVTRDNEAGLRALFGMAQPQIANKH